MKGRRHAGTIAGVREGLQSGTVLEGTYRIGRQIARGGMGAVYEASHVRLEGRYAVKFLRPEVAAQYPAALARFRREARITSALRHPGIVQVIDFHTPPDGPPFMVMEYLDGAILAEVIAREAPLSLARVCDLTSQIASALLAAHRKGVVHRDLNPANVVVLPAEDPTALFAGDRLRDADRSGGVRRRDAWRTRGSRRPGCAATVGPGVGGARRGQRAQRRRARCRIRRRPCRAAGSLPAPVPAAWFRHRGGRQDPSLNDDPGAGPPRSRGEQAPTVILRRRRRLIVLARRARRGWARLLDLLRARPVLAVGAVAAALLAVVLVVHAARARQDPPRAARVVLADARPSSSPVVLPIAPPPPAPPAPAPAPPEPVAAVAAPPVRAHALRVKAEDSEAVTLGPDDDAPLETQVGIGAGPAPASCSLTLGSSPWASVWLDGRDTGLHTPVVQLPLSCGTHVLQLKRQDLRLAHQATVVLHAGDHLKARYALEPGDEGRAPGQKPQVLAQLPVGCLPVIVW